MATPNRLTAVIRFHLNELCARNGHHEFEHIARHVARSRLYSNIIAATGPVSAGGDAGRDFETFRTGADVITTSGATFLQRSSVDRRVAFACSLEQRIENKIRSDIKSILSKGSVDEIIYFCGKDVPIAKRQKLVKEAEDHRVCLQIFDGTALAEWLAEADIFWIAQEYLHIPAELFPSEAQHEEWYSELRVGLEMISFWLKRLRCAA